MIPHNNLTLEARDSQPRAANVASSRKLTRGEVNDFRERPELKAIRGMRIRLCGWSEPYQNQVA